MRSRFRRLTLVAFLAFAAVDAARGQIPSYITVQKTTRFRQKSADALDNEKASCFVGVHFASAVTPSTRVTLRGPVTLSLTPVRPGWSYSFAHDFASEAERETAVPDGTYQVEVTGEGTPTSTSVLVATLPQPSPVRITNFDSLQSVGAGSIRVEWQRFPRLAGITMAGIRFPWSEGAEGFEGWTTVGLAMTSAQIGFFPRNSGETAVAALSFSGGSSAVANGGQTNIDILNGFDVLFSIRRAAFQVGRISNLSVLAPLSGSDRLSVGFVVGGANTAGSKAVLVRAVGPSLRAVGVDRTLSDPAFDLFAGTTRIGGNDNWAGGSYLDLVMNTVGAFPFASATSTDAAAVVSVASAAHSVQLRSVDPAEGLVLAEIYDLTPAAEYTTATPRLVNVSVLHPVGSGLAVGFTLAGDANHAVLIRAVGPGLRDFNVSGFVGNPRLSLYNSAGRRIAENEDWGGLSTLGTTFARVGAFNLPVDSRDAALMASLGAGGYSVQVAGVENDPGLVLVEIYEIP